MSSRDCFHHAIQRFHMLAFRRMHYTTCEAICSIKTKRICTQQAILLHTFQGRRVLWIKARGEIYFGANFFLEIQNKPLEKLTIFTKGKQLQKRRNKKYKSSKNAVFLGWRNEMTAGKLEEKGKSERKTNKKQHHQRVKRLKNSKLNSGRFFCYFLLFFLLTKVNSMNWKNIGNPAENQTLTFCREKMFKASRNRFFFLRFYLNFLSVKLSLRISDK